MGLLPSSCFDCNESPDATHSSHKPNSQQRFTLAGVYPVEKNVLKDMYRFGTKLGNGKFGQVIAAKRLDDDQERAIKTVLTVKSNSEFENNLRLEILNMSMLHHPNIIRLHRVFETPTAVHMVLDLCTGGDLFTRIEEMDERETSYSENTIAKWVHQMLLAISHCHNHGICHRDIKPENFLFKDKSQESCLLLCDFGYSAIFRVRNQTTSLRGLVGTVFYVAPEVLVKDAAYTEAIDVWSIGVILHVLLCGVPPYCGSSDKSILESIRKNRRSSPPSKIWKHVSLDAKTLVDKMLRRDAQRRITVHEALSLRWVVYHGDGKAPSPKSTFNSDTLQQLQSFGASQRLKKTALQWIANSSDKNEIIGLRQKFRALDRDGNGVITLMELHTGLSELRGLSVDVAKALKLFVSVDIDSSGGIEYEEFVAAVWSARHKITLHDLQRAFEHFDIDHSGYITVDDLRTLYDQQDGAKLQSEKQSEIAAMIAASDSDGDGRIDYKEFIACFASLDLSAS